jgi:hypothetical protein
MKKQKKKKQKSNLNNKQRKQIIRLLLLLGAIIIITIGILTYANLGGFKEQQQKETFPIQDECSRVMGNIVHSYQDQGGCKLRCLNECEIRKKTFIEATFQEKNEESACYQCSCTCL